MTRPLPSPLRSARPSARPAPLPPARHAAFAALVAIAAIAAATASATAQGVEAGFTDLSFHNPTGQGDRVLLARVHYPAETAGRDAPLVPRAGGHPVVVFLHGLGARGRQYPELGDDLARRGNVAVLLDNGAVGEDLALARNGNAMFAALVVANGQSGHFLAGALNMTRAALSGHSMGGRAMVIALQDNPGFRCAFAFAPAYGGEALDRIDVPLGVVHGTGDSIVQWQRGARLVRELASYTGIKLLYLMNGDCDHLNLVGVFVTTTADRAVWARSAAVAWGFFRAYLGDHPDGLEETIGPAARADSRLVSLEVGVETPVLWRAGSASRGGTARLRVVSEPGAAGIAIAAGTASIPLPIGVLRLDPATVTLVSGGAAGAERLYTHAFAVPDDVALVGRTFPFQGFGQSAPRGIWLTGAALLTVEP